jgi:predicted dehydrogenase
MPRFIFGTEPGRVISLIDRDPDLRTDRVVSCILDFPNGQASFVCSTQIARYQRMQFFGTLGRIELEIPVNAPPDRPCRIIVDDGRDVFGSGIEIIEIPTCNQYTIQGDVFSRAIREDGELPISLESSVLNMRVIDAIFRSEKSRDWESP